MAREIFIGMESTNLHLFESTCCGCGLAVEPLCQVCCQQCGKEVLTSKEYREKKTNSR